MRGRLNLREERGAVMIFVAAALPAFIAFGIFVVDVGNWWVHKRHLQIQADAAALAGAAQFNYPNCNDEAIVSEALRYSGGVKWDTTPPRYAATEPPLADRFNLQLGGSDPALVYTGINRPDPFGRPDPLNPDPPPSPIDPELELSPKPCEVGFIDVKVTETDLPWFFANFGITEFIDAQARVSLQNMTNSKNTIPIGVEDVNPKRVHAWFYDEVTGLEIGDAELYRNGSDDGMLVFDNSASNGNPASQAITTSLRGSRVGVKIALSGSDSILCGTALVLCFGSSTDGVTRIRGYDAQTGGLGTEAVHLGPVHLVKQTCANNIFGAHDNGYFSTTCTADTIRTTLPGLSTAAASATSVKARIQWKNSDKVVNLTWDGEFWTGTNLPIDPVGGGSRKVDIEWSQEAGTLGGLTCRTGNQNPCKGTFADAHKVFSGSRPISGPIKDLRIDVDGSTGVNNVARCSLLEACPHDFVVRVALSGRLELAGPNDPPISLKVFGEANSHALDCDPGITAFEREIADGCGPNYAINTGQACPNAVPVLWTSPQPWRCVAVQTGTFSNKPAEGLNERVLCRPANSVGNCTQFGRPTSCTNWDKFPDQAPEDPRIMPVFVVPFGTFDTAGNGTVPVIDFAYFYVRGWTSNGAGFANPCKNDPVNPDTFADGTSNDNGAISGNFVKPATPNNGNGSGGQVCDLTTISACVAVMTK